MFFLFFLFYQFPLFQFRKRDGRLDVKAVYKTNWSMVDSLSVHFFNMSCDISHGVSPSVFMSYILLLTENKLLKH